MLLLLCEPKAQTQRKKRMIQKKKGGSVRWVRKANGKQSMVRKTKEKKKRREGEKERESSISTNDHRGRCRL